MSNVSFGMTLKVNKHRTVEVDGPVKNLTSQADALLEMAEKNKKPVFVVINTYGGSVFGGLPLIRALEQLEHRGVPTVCVVTDAAMSMGMHIFASCRHRFAFRTSLLMWHPASISLMFARVTEKKAEQWRVQLRLITKYLEDKLKDRLQISEETYKNYHENEYIVPGATLKAEVAPRFFKLVDDVRTYE